MLNMSDQTQQIRILLNNQCLTLPRYLILSETESKQIQQDKDICLSMPEWVTKEVYLLIVEYLETKQIKFLEKYIQNNHITTKLLRTSDYLYLQKFQDRFIMQLLINNINMHNCLILIDESHKKLKNMNNSQSWFKLLNAGINYLADNLYAIYEQNQDKFRYLNQKIINEVLQNVIKAERKIGFRNQHAFYKIINRCKARQIKQSGSLCYYLRNVLVHKKIVPKIHAKLSWKLENIQEITNKKTKIFSFLDYKWYLCAEKCSQGLKVTLNFINSSRYSQSASSWQTSSASNSSKALQDGSPSNRPQGSRYNHDQYTKIGVFYTKLTYSVGSENSQQKQANIHYISLNQRSQNLTNNSTIQIITFSPEFQRAIKKEKVQLTIFCNIDQIYTFVINYILNNFGALNLHGRQFAYEELYIMVMVSKECREYTRALRISAELLYKEDSDKTDKKKIQQIWNNLFLGYNFGEMTKIELDIYEDLINRRNDTKKKDVKQPINNNQNSFPQKNTNILKPYLKMEPKSIERKSEIKKSPINLSKKQGSIKSSSTSKNHPLPITPVGSVVRTVNFDLSHNKITSNNNSYRNSHASQNKKNKSSNNQQQKIIQKNQINTQNNFWQFFKTNILTSPQPSPSSQLTQQQPLLINSLRNSRALSHTSNASNSSKRKIFSRLNNENNQAESDLGDADSYHQFDYHEIILEMKRVTDFRNYFKPAAVNTNGHSEVYLQYQRML